MRRLVLLATAVCLAGCVKIRPADPTVLPRWKPADTVFLRAEDGLAKSGLPAYRRVVDSAELATYRNWLNNDAARWALELYSQAFDIARSRGLARTQPAAYHIALEIDGNYPAEGFRVRNGAAWDEYRDAAYIRLGPTWERFATTLLHETGHVAAMMLSAGRNIEPKPLIPVPHTTAALTDRLTAFSEGYGIHLETLAAHLFADERIRRAFHHDRVLFGASHGRRGEFFRPTTDLLTYAQTASRYYEVRENAFAFDSAFTGPDFFRVQFEKARDLSTLRDANQLLQSEGFHATFFYSWLMHGDERPSFEELRARQGRMLEAMTDMFAARQQRPDAPWLLWFVEAYAKRYPDEKAVIVDALLDLSHGVFVDAQAPKLWREHYLAAVRLDLNNAAPGRISDVRKRWRDAVLEDFNVLYSRLGPQIRCEVSDVPVELKALGRAAPLSFDLNTAQRGILRMIPGIREAEVERWLAERARKPFASPDDFRTRVPLSPEVSSRLSMTT